MHQSVPCINYITKFSFIVLRAKVWLFLLHNHVIISGKDGATPFRSSAWGFRFLLWYGAMFSGKCSPTKLTNHVALNLFSCVFAICLYLNDWMLNETFGNSAWTKWFKSGVKLPVYHPGSVAPPCRCSPWSPPSWAGRCRSAGQWLRGRRSCLCTLTARQSPGSSPPRSPPPGRTRRRISAWAWRGCQSPRCGKKVALPRRLTCFFCLFFPACTDPQSRSSCLSFFCWTATAFEPVAERRWSHCVTKEEEEGEKTALGAMQAEITPTAEMEMWLKRRVNGKKKSSAAEAISATTLICLLICLNKPAT